MNILYGVCTDLWEGPKPTMKVMIFPRFSFEKSENLNILQELEYFDK